MHFDPTVTLGTLISIFSTLGAVVWAYARLDKRVALLEQLASEYLPEVKRLRAAVDNHLAIEGERGSTRPVA